MRQFTEIRESCRSGESFPCHPLSPYGRHKVFAEEICNEYHEYFGIKTCSLRIFSAFGPGLKKQILWDIYQKSLHGDLINLCGTGMETRDFVFIDDIVDAIHKVMLSGDFNAGIYNVASGKEITIRELADNILEVIDYKGKLNFSGNEKIECGCLTGKRTFLLSENSGMNQNHPLSQV